ncbi:MAG: hypothetical protein AAF721_12575 [Myxococcota bacterium]
MKSQSSLALLLLSGTFIGVAAPSPSAHAGFTQVKPGTIKINGVKYWRKKAEEAKLGSVGKKMAPLAGKNYFQHVQDAPAGIYDVVALAENTTINTSKASSWGVDVGHSNVSGGVSGSGAYTGDVTVYKLKINHGNTPGDLKHATNRNHKQLEAVKAEGNAARIISSVWILVRGNESKAECYSGELSVTHSGVTVKPKASGCQSSSYTLNGGSILAYEMVKIDKWDDNEISTKPSCASGHVYEKRSSTVTPMDRCKKTTTVTSGVKCKLGPLDKRANWYVSARSGKDTCKSKKGKPDKSVICSKSGYSYVSQSGKDKCTKASYSYKDPFCSAPGYDYNKKSTSNGGLDQCELRGIESLKPDSMDGF